jgi:hypothetical protein
MWIWRVAKNNDNPVLLRAVRACTDLLGVGFLGVESSGLTPAQLADVDLSALDSPARAVTDAGAGAVIRLCCNSACADFAAA